MESIQSGPFHQNKKLTTGEQQLHVVEQSDDAIARFLRCGFKLRGRGDLTKLVP